MVFGLATLPAGAANPTQNGFTLEDITNTLSAPVAFGFTDAGRLYVAEKRGTIQVFDNVDDPSPTQVVDIRNQVHDFWDRGLLGFAVDPQFGSGSDYLYLLYTLEPAPSWNDACADATGAGCTVNGRLSRFLINANGTAGAEVPLLTGQWCSQYPSHTVGDLAFTSGGYLLVSAGDGASFDFADHGGPPNPSNSCGDPLGDAGVADNEGGALRSQDLRTPSDPLSFDGSVVKVDKVTGAATLIAHGFRNPFRITERPGTSEIWVGDVGWGAWEEVNRIEDPNGSIENFGWPCYEGSARQPTYDSLNLNLCEVLYTSGTVVAPHYARHHADVPSGCGGGGGAISGLAFYEGGHYPSYFDGALFMADYSIGCIRVMFPNTTSGDPDKNDIETFVTDAAPVDLQIGPDGDLFYADIMTGRIVRVDYNSGPTASIDANPLTGSVPLTVDFDGTGSTDSEGDVLSYAWDLDGDGQFDDSTAPRPSHTYTAVGSVTVGLRVQDPAGASDTDSITINPVANRTPVATISSPSSSLVWKVGDLVSFTGSATDPDDVPPTLTWDVIMNHCDDGNCHEHTLQTFSGSGGQFYAPSHAYPSYISIRLTATDNGGLQDVEVRDIQPRTSIITIASDPVGLQVSAGTEGLSTFTSPGQLTAIVGSTLTVAAPTPQTLGSTAYTFSGWSDGGAQTHTITVPESDTTLTASFNVSTGGGGGGGGGGSGGGAGGSSSPQFEDVPSEHPFFTFIAWMAEKQITLGCAANLYCPNDPVTRAQMASFLVRAFSLPPASSDQFVDIAGSPHESNIDALVAFGITKGCDIDRYCPEMSVTRGQMASFLVRTFLLPAGPDLFTDDEGSVHEADINALAQAGITFGCEPTKFCPDDVVTRAEMAAFLFRSYNR